MSAPDWVVYYSDGSRIASTDSEVTGLPAVGVQVVLQRDGRCGRRVLKLVDYYLWAPSISRWIDCMDAASVIMRTIREPWVKVLAGEYLREKDFERILIAAYNDADLPGVSPDNPPHPAWRA